MQEALCHKAYVSVNLDVGEDVKCMARIKSTARIRKLIGR